MAKTAQQTAIDKYIEEADKFSRGGAAEYDAGENLGYEELERLEQLGPSGLANISTDPRYQNAQLDALRALEEQGRDGFTARDLADQARSDGEVNRQTRGRIGAIKQNMEARGISGSGMDMVSQQMAAQDAAEMQALQALERDAVQSERRTQGTVQAGNLAGSLSDQEYGRKANAANAQDAINRFNTQNSVQRQQYNNQNRNQTNEQNWQRGNQTSDNNVNANYQFRKDSTGVQQQAAAKTYDYATELENQAKMRAADRKAQNKGKNAFAGQMVGAAAGSFFGPAGTAAGGALGGAIGGMFAHGGVIEGPEVTEGDSLANDIIPVQVSAGEIVIPKSIATDPMKAAKFVAEQNGEELDPVGLLLEAMQSMRKK